MGFTASVIVGFPTKAVAEKVRTVAFRATLYYSSYDAPTEAVAQSHGWLSVAAGRRDPHLSTTDSLGRPLTVVGTWGEIVRGYSSPPAAIQVGINIASDQMLHWLMSSLPKRGEHLDEAAAMIDRYAEFDLLSIGFRENRKRPNVEYPFSAVYFFHDEMSEETLQLWIEVSDKALSGITKGRR